MRAVIQRCNWARVVNDGVETSKISKGMLVLLGVKKGDTEKDCEYICNKIINMRIFEDENGKMNKSLLESGGKLLLVSQFTLYGDVRHGRRPGFIEAELPDRANELYEKTVEMCSKYVKVGTGKFQTDMKVSLENDGPVTMQLDSRKMF